MKHWKPSLRHPDHRGDAVQLVFTNAGLSPQTLLRRYPKINELGAPSSLRAWRVPCAFEIPIRATGRNVETRTKNHGEIANTIHNHE